MKKTTAIVAALSVAIMAALVFIGCAGTRIQQLSGPEFMKQAEQTAQMSSFNWTSFIGAGNDRVYLEYGYPAFVGKGIRVTVYWTHSSELPGNVLEQINSGASPWTNWMDRIGQPLKK